MKLFSTNDFSPVVLIKLVSVQKIGQKFFPCSQNTSSNIIEKKYLFLLQTTDFYKVDPTLYWFCNSENVQLFVY